jgi:hypothetical protein
MGKYLGTGEVEYLGTGTKYLSLADKSEQKHDLNNHQGK